MKNDAFASKKKGYSRWEKNTILERWWKNTILEGEKKAKNDSNSQVHAVP